MFALTNRSLFFILGCIISTCSSLSTATIDIGAEDAAAKFADCSAYFQVFANRLGSSGDIVENTIAQLGWHYAASALSEGARLVGRDQIVAMSDVRVGSLVRQLRNNNAQWKEVQDQHKDICNFAIKYPKQFIDQMRLRRAREAG